MTTQQLVMEVIDLREARAKSDIEHQQFRETLNHIEEDVKTTKQLTEEVHIMASTISNMQKTLDKIDKKVEELDMKEFKEYKETKGHIKKNILSGVIGSIITALVGGIGYLVNLVIQLKQATP